MKPFRSQYLDKLAERGASKRPGKPRKAKPDIAAAWDAGARTAAELAHYLRGHHRLAGGER